MDQQKQGYQSQATLPQTSTSTHINGGDWQEEAYQQIIVMKERYYPELHEMYQKIAMKLRKHESLAPPPNLDTLEKLKLFKVMLERLMTVLNISKSGISPGLKEKLGLYEKQIINFINSIRPTKPVSVLNVPPPKIQNTHLLQQPKVEQQDSNDHDFITQTSDTSGADWQEELYQKIKVMKETYLPELSEMYQKIVSKLQEVMVNLSWISPKRLDHLFNHPSRVACVCASRCYHNANRNGYKQESLPPTSNPDFCEKLKMFKTLLERHIAVLQVSKSSIWPGLKEKLGLYEKQIISFINTNRLGKPVSSLHLPSPEIHNAHGLQQPKVEPQDGQQSQPHPSQQNHFSDFQPQVGHMQQHKLSLQQHQLSLQQQSNPLQQDMQHRLQASGQVSGAILQAPNTMELQNQLYQSHRSFSETSSTSLDYPAQTGHGDWREEAYRKIKVMKHLYFAELSETYWKIATELQLDSHFQQQTSDQYEKLSMSKNKLEGFITVLHYSKTDISPGLKEKLVFYEKQIVDFINTYRLRSGEGDCSFLQSMATISLKALVDKRSNKVIFIEESDDFIDVLFSFLTLPLGKLIKLARQGSLGLNFHCIHNVYRSVENIDASLKHFLDPSYLAAPYLNKHLTLEIEDLQGSNSTVKLFCYRNCKQSHRVFGLFGDISVELYEWD